MKAALLTLALASSGLNYRGAPSPTVTLDRSWPGGSRRVLAERGPLTIRVSIEPFEDEASAARKLGDMRARLLAPFEGEMSYPGMVTKTFGVPLSLRPREIRSGGGRPVWIIPATERLSYGAGSDELAKRRAVVSLWRCPQVRVVVQLELFWPSESFDEDAALREESRYVCRSGAADLKP